VRADFPVLLDACVLVPMPLADLLLRLAAGPRLYLPKWTDQIMNEVSRTLQERLGVTREKAQYREGELRRHHEKDRHVLAAALRVGAEVIVTYNLKDFPDSSLASYSIAAQGPSSFLQNLHEMDPPAVMQSLEEQAEAIRQPLPYLLSRLRINVPGFVATIE
jgi:hypothetical protein